MQTRFDTVAAHFFREVGHVIATRFDYHDEADLADVRSLHVYILNYEKLYVRADLVANWLNTRHHTGIGRDVSRTQWTSAMSEPK